VYSLLLVCVLPLSSAHEAAGATGTRRSPRPLRAEDLSTARAHGAARSRTCVFRRHCEPTGRANARPMTGSAKQSILTFFVLDGLLRCARNDGLCCLKLNRKLARRASYHLAPLAGRGRSRRLRVRGLSASPSMWRVRLTPIRQERASRLCNPEDRCARAGVVNQP
jgi:hypothetical protein